MTTINTEWKPDDRLRRIVCAANRYTNILRTILLLGPRHWDDTMRYQYDQMKCIVPHHMFEQGFIDQFGTWYNRVDALVIAKRRQQIRRDIGYESDELFSEMLY